MQRLAERCGARTPFDLLDAMRELWRGVEQAVDWDKAITYVLDGEQDIPIVRPKFVPVAGGKAVFEWDARAPEGPFADPTARLPQAPEMAARRRAEQRRYRERQGARKAANADIAA